MAAGGPHSAGISGSRRWSLMIKLMAINLVNWGSERVRKLSTISIEL